LCPRIVERAFKADPANRVYILAQSVQPFSGWALRWAVQDCRERGMPWTEIAGILNWPYSTVLCQVQAGEELRRPDAVAPDGNRA
jgi:hypothetical protein